MTGFREDSLFNIISIVRINTDNAPLSKMRISILPAGDQRIASSRIRAYGFRRALKEVGIEAKIGEWEAANIIYVQKRVDRRLLRRLAEKRKSGSLIWYDCDDAGDARRFWAPDAEYAAMLGLSDLVTTNSRGLRDRLARRVPSERIFLVPDVVDYGIKRPLSPPDLDPLPLRLIWFGNRRNLHLLLRHGGCLGKIPALEVIVATDTRADLGAAPPRNFRLVPWDRTTFLKLLRSCHLSFLPHDGSEEDRLKSSNRMVASIISGVPAIVTRTPEYERTARLVGAGDYVLDSPLELPRLISRLADRAQRRAYIEKAQAKLWAIHSPASVGRRIAEVLRSVSEGS